MTTVQLASVFGPLLFYPSQSLSSRLAPDMLRAYWQISILAQLLDVWPGSKSVYAMLPPRPNLPPPKQPSHVPRSHLHQRHDRIATRGLAYHQVYVCCEQQETDAGYLSEPTQRHPHGVAMMPQRQTRIGAEMAGGRRYHTDLPLRRMYSGDYETFNYQEDAGDTPSRIIPYDPRFYRTRKRL
ncbi:hypothetical protein Ciccas_005021 [Cichlidogyrus casuarinus]|uniref:Rho-GAP domain-containing protein n=1 Tax=Cichlidogyrus casuarinus TaxID=1844966 RepID=A0ABD2Q9U7_9PLAT